MISNTDKEIISNQAETIKILKCSLASQAALTASLILEKKNAKTKKAARKNTLKRMEDIGATSVRIKPELFFSLGLPV